MLTRRSTRGVMVPGTYMRALNHRPPPSKASAPDNPAVANQGHCRGRPTIPPPLSPAA